MAMFPQVGSSQYHFRHAEYGSLLVPPEDNESQYQVAATVSPSATVQKRCALAFAQRRRDEVDWALGVLAWQTHTEDIVLLPAYRLLDELMEILQSTLRDVRKREKAAAGASSGTQDTYFQPEGEDEEEEDKAAAGAQEEESVDQDTGTATDAGATEPRRRRPLVNPDAFYWGVTPEGHSLWVARQLSLILRSLTFVEENEEQIAQHPGTVHVMLEMLSSEDAELSMNALHALANLAHAVTLSAEDSGRELIALLFGFLAGEEESHRPALEAFVKLAVHETNRDWVLLADASLFDRLDSLLFSPDAYIQDLAASLLALFASFGSSQIKTAIATTSAAHLVKLLSSVVTDLTRGSVTREQLSFAEHSITAVYHLASEPANGEAFAPYLDVFLHLCAAVDDSPVRKHMQGVRNIMYNIIVELGGSEM